MSPWKLTRILFGLSVLLTWVPRSRGIIDNYSSSGIVVSSGPLHFTDWVVWSPATAWVLWGLLPVSALLIMAGRATRIALATFIVCSFALMGSEGLNMKGYDRLLGWQAFALLFCGGDGDRNRVARFMLMMTYTNLYASTGLFKLFIPGWWDGTAMALNFVDLNFGGRALGVWMSGFPWMCFAAGWFSIAVELGLAALIWFRRTNPWILALGVLFHIGIFLTLHVNTFSLVAVAAYPALLHPSCFRRPRPAEELPS